jgi:hypothetical protein
MRRLVALSWGLLVLAAVTAGAAAQDFKLPPPEPGSARKGNKPEELNRRKEDKPEDLNRLLVARHEVLQKTVAVALNQYKAGFMDLGRVVRAEQELLKASLELPQPAEKRLAALREFRDLAEKTLEITRGRARAGTVTQLDALEAEAMFLEAQIALLREQAKGRPGK